MYISNVLILFSYFFRENIPDINLREHIDLRDLEAKQRVNIFIIT